MKKKCDVADPAYFILTPQMCHLVISLVWALFEVIMGKWHSSRRCAHHGVVKAAYSSAHA